MKAWANLSRYEAGTNLRAWLFTILRNTFYSEHRKHRLEIEDADGHLAAGLSTPARQNDHMDFEDFRVALLQLAPDQREALILVGASGLSYEEAAEICGCAVGTIKSRVNRARGRLGELLGLEVGERGADPAARTRQAERCRKSRRAGRGLAKLTRRSSSGRPLLRGTLTPESRAPAPPRSATPRATLLCRLGTRDQARMRLRTRLCRDLPESAVARAGQSNVAPSHSARPRNSIGLGAFTSQEGTARRRRRPFAAQHGERNE